MPREDRPLRVLVCEDEESFVDALVIGLEREGFSVSVAMDGRAALDTFADVKPDIVLLDLMLPKMSGIDVCRTIRLHSSVPIIMVTAKSTEIDTVVGLEVGADDYVTKPYRMRELVARMRAVLRRERGDAVPEALAGGGVGGGGVGVGRPGGAGVGRVDGAGADEVADAAFLPTLTVGDVKLDPERHRVTVRGAEVNLPLKEFELLETLLVSAGRVLTRDTLIDRVWGADYVGDTKTLDVHIKRLRARIEPDPAHPVHITTIRGLGYRYEVG